MSRALIAKPVFSDELGLLMFRPEQSALQAFRKLLDKSSVLLAPAPDDLAMAGAGLIDHKTEANALPARLVLLFVRQGKVFQALGGSIRFTRWQGRAERCVIHGDDCAGGITWSAGHYQVPLCWHHDNAHRAEPIAEVSTVIARRLVAFALSQIAIFAKRTRGGDVSALELTGWAIANEVYELLPESLARTALGRQDASPDRHTAHGWKDTDVRYDTRDHIADISKMVKPIKFTVDPEPPASFMARPKLTRWESAGYLKFVRSQPCVVTGTTEAIEAHHVIGHGHSGMAMKTHDIMTFPLSHQAHMKLHDGGWQQWERQHGSQLEHVMATINKAAGLGVFG